MPIDNTPIVFVRRRKLRAVQVVCVFCGERHWHDHHRLPGAIWYGCHTAPCGSGDYLVMDVRRIMYEEGDVERLFAEVDAAVAKFGPDSVAFGDDCQVEFRRVQKTVRPDLDRREWLELFAARRARHETILASRKAQRQRRFEMLIQEQTALMYYLPRQRTAEENQRLYDLSLEIGTMLALRSPSARYSGPLGTWPDAA